MKVENIFDLGNLLLNTSCLAYVKEVALYASLRERNRFNERKEHSSTSKELAFQGGAKKTYGT
ncbi:hypothetical protein N8482_00830 [Chitinophagales bacterium]|nr:hypothetical protein [Chitinophagales bacterium]